MVGIVGDRRLGWFVAHEAAMAAIVAGWLLAERPAVAAFNGLWLVSAAVWWFVGGRRSS
jgi:hypothetical protein